MANELTQIEITGQGTWDIKDAGASPTNHTHTSAWAASSHVHYVNESRVAYSTWGTIASTGTNNNATQALQLASWGGLGTYTGYFKNKNQISVSAIGQISTNNLAYTITVTAARPYGAGKVLYRHDGIETLEASTNGNINLKTSYSTGSSRTAAVDSINLWFCGTVELQVSQLGNGWKQTSTPG